MGKHLWLEMGHWADGGECGNILQAEYQLYHLLEVNARKNFLNVLNMWKSKTHALLSMIITLLLFKNTVSFNYMEYKIFTIL